MLSRLAIAGGMKLFLRFMSYESNLEHQIRMQELSTGVDWGFLHRNDEVEKILKDFKLMYSPQIRPTSIFFKQVGKQKVYIFEYKKPAKDWEVDFYCILIKRETAVPAPFCISDTQVRRWYQVNSQDVVFLNPQPNWWHEKLFAHRPLRSSNQIGLAEIRTVTLGGLDPLIGLLVKHPFFAGLFFNQNYVALHTFGSIPVMNDLFADTLKQAESLARGLEELDQSSEIQSELQQLKAAESKKQ